MRTKSLQESYRGGRFKEWQANYLRVAEVTSVDPEEQRVDLRFLDTPGLRTKVKLTYPYASFNSAGIMYIPQVGDLAIVGAGKNNRIFILSYIPQWIHGKKDALVEGKKEKVYPYYSLTPGEVFLRSVKGQFIWLETYGEFLSRIVLGDIKQNRFQIEQDNRKMYGTTGLYHFKAGGALFELGEARDLHLEGLDVPYSTEDKTKGWHRARIIVPEYFSQKEGGEETDIWQEEHPIIEIEAGTVLEESNGEAIPVVNDDGNELSLRIRAKRGAPDTEYEAIRIEVDKNGQLEIFGRNNLHLKFDSEGNMKVEVERLNIVATQDINIESSGDIIYEGNVIKLGKNAFRGVARLGDSVKTGFWSGKGSITTASSKAKAE